MATIKGIIFDMDNTILRSSIDFDSMKQATYAFLSSRGVLPPGMDLTGHTTSTIIGKALETQRMSKALIEEMWEIPKEFEMIGMRNAPLEPGVVDLLQELQHTYCLVILTNNSVEAAEAALEENGILGYFDGIVGREHVDSMKPSPDGVLYILNRYRHIPAKAWISVGDSWIDGKAAQEAGIDFILYQGNLHKLNQMGVSPQAQIKDIRELKNYIIPS